MALYAAKSGVFFRVVPMQQNKASPWNSCLKSSRRSKSTSSSIYFWSVIASVFRTKTLTDLILSSLSNSCTNSLPINPDAPISKTFFCMDKGRIVYLHFWMYAFVPPIKILNKFIMRIIISIWKIIRFYFLFFLTKKETKKSRLWISILFANHYFTTIYNSSRTIFTPFWNWNFSKMFLQKF